MTDYSHSYIPVSSVWHDDVIIWKHFYALLALCEGNPPVTGGFPSQRPVTQSYDVFLDLRLNKRLSKQSRWRWFETSLRSLWCHCNGKSTGLVSSSHTWWDYFDPGWSAVFNTFRSRQNGRHFPGDIFKNAFSWMKMHLSRLRYHLSLFPRVQLTTFKHWFR